MKESTIETRLRKAVERAGGRCLKFVSPGHTGVPDRIILMPGGRVYFAETKAPGERERARQEYVQRRLRGLGFEVFSRVDSDEKIADVVSRIGGAGMKIIKDGNLDKLKRTKRFTCTECGCVFEADKGEYVDAVNQWESEASAECPCCKHTAYEVRMRGHER